MTHPITILLVDDHEVAHLGADDSCAGGARALFLLISLPVLATWRRRNLHLTSILRSDSGRSGAPGCRQRETVVKSEYVTVKTSGGSISWTLFGQLVLVADTESKIIQHNNAGRAALKLEAHLYELRRIERGVGGDKRLQRKFKVLQHRLGCRRRGHIDEGRSVHWRGDLIHVRPTSRAMPIGSTAVEKGCD